MSAADARVDLDQVERYQFSARFAEAPFPALTVDEPPPAGRDAGPNPAQSLAVSVGHCMSSTLVNTLERAHVAATPVHTTVRVEVGVNDQGRRRVRRITVEMVTRPLHDSDRDRFDHCVEIFADYCTVSGAVREGIPIDHSVRSG